MAGSDDIDTSSKYKTLISTISRKRGYSKRTITIVINKLNEFKTQGKLTSSFFKVQYEKILKEVDLIKIHDSEILNVLEDEKVEEIDFDFFTKEVESQVDYHFSLDCL